MRSSRRPVAGMLLPSTRSLAGYETPKSVVFAADLPETVGGKVLKYRLRAEHAGHYRDASP